jgi:2-oxoglutarate dehydrogenase E1 component
MSAPELSSLNLPFIEGLYEQYLNSPTSLPAEWQNFFADLEKSEAFPPDFGPQFSATSIFNPPGANISAGETDVLPC